MNNETIFITGEKMYKSYIFAICDEDGKCQDIQINAVCMEEAVLGFHQHLIENNIRLKNIDEIDESHDLPLELPDPSISQADMLAYGYTDCNMIPLRANMASMVFGKIGVYALFQDGREELIEDADLIAAHSGAGGIFGIRAYDFEEAGEVRSMLYPSV